ncbi:Ku protein [Candidatus Collierbacteria bacterium]|nr:Ku protein [Candidatus Collierbacteria bacterium]
MKAIWSGNLKLALINIPVRLLPGSKSRQLNFTYLTKKGQSPIRYARVSKLGGEEVPFNEIVKGFEYDPGKFAVIDDKDLESANPKLAHTIEVLNFTDPSNIDKRLFSKPYYLQPESQTNRSYFLLRETLKESGRVGIVRYLINKTKEHLGALTVAGDYLLIIQMRFASDLIPSESLPELIAPLLPEEELSLTRQLVESLTSPFNPNAYTDTHTQEVKKLIREKIAGQTPRISSPPISPTPSTDLARQLSDSLSLTTKRPFFSP